MGDTNGAGEGLEFEEEFILQETEEAYETWRRTFRALNRNGMLGLTALFVIVGILAGNPIQSFSRRGYLWGWLLLALVVVSGLFIVIMLMLIGRQLTSRYWLMYRLEELADDANVEIPGPTHYDAHWFHSKNLGIMPPIAVAVQHLAGYLYLLLATGVGIGAIIGFWTTVGTVSGWSVVAGLAVTSLYVALLAGTGLTISTFYCTANQLRTGEPTSSSICTTVTSMVSAFARFYGRTDEFLPPSEDESRDS